MGHHEQFSIIAVVATVRISGELHSCRALYIRLVVQTILFAIEKNTINAISTLMTTAATATTSAVSKGVDVGGVTVAQLSQLRRWQRC